MRLGMLFNGLLKVPMQFFILFVGVMVFVFYQFNQAPLHFNPLSEQLIQKTPYETDYENLNNISTQNYQNPMQIGDVKSFKEKLTSFTEIQEENYEAENCCWYTISRILPCKLRYACLSLSFF